MDEEIDNITPQMACHCCGQVRLDPTLVPLLLAVQDAIGRPLSVSSGFRCKAHNTAVGGAVGSQHCQGKAADLLCLGRDDQAKIIEQAKIVGFTGIGIDLNFTFVHVDVRSLPASWTYPVRHSV